MTLSYFQRGGWGFRITQGHGNEIQGPGNDRSANNECMMYEKKHTLLLQSHIPYKKKWNKKKKKKKKKQRTKKKINTEKIEIKKNCLSWVSNPYSPISKDDARTDWGNRPCNAIRRYLSIIDFPRGDVCACVCVCVFGFNVAFNNFSVISRRCLFATGSSVLIFIVLPHWSIMSQTLDMIPHLVTLS